MMRKVLFLFFVIALAAAAPADEKPIEILRTNFDIDPAGSYNYGFETGNGIQQEETGEVKTVLDEEGKETSAVVVTGRFSYTDPDGQTIEVTYTADEHGFHPTGNHIPNAADVGGSAAAAAAAADSPAGKSGKRRN